MVQKDTPPKRHAFVDGRDREHVERAADESARDEIACAVTAYRRAETLRTGDSAPRLELTDVATGQLAPLVPAGDRPQVLIFGSYT